MKRSHSLDYHFDNQLLIFVLHNHYNVIPYEFCLKIMNLDFDGYDMNKMKDSIRLNMNNYFVFKIHLHKDRKVNYPNDIDLK